MHVAILKSSFDLNGNRNQPARFQPTVAHCRSIEMFMQFQNLPNFVAMLADRRKPQNRGKVKVIILRQVLTNLSSFDKIYFAR